MTGTFDLVFVGLTLSSSWGNGHATTYRSLLRGLAERGLRILFLECDKPWYAANRDLADPEFCTLAYYDGVADLVGRFDQVLASADAVIVGSYVPDGVATIDALATLGIRHLCFYDIDTPVTLAGLDRGEEDFLALRQIPLFDIYFSFSGGRVLDRLEQRYEARRAEALYCAVDAERYRSTGEAPAWHLGYLGTYSPDRQPVLEKLLIEPARRLPHRRFVVAGPQYPSGIDWPANVERIDHLPPAAHPAFYSRQRFTLNVTRADMIAAGWSPSVRLFEAAACGVPVISDEWPGLTDLFPEGDTIVIARKTGDVVAALETMDDARRAAMAKRARCIVTEHHTGKARAHELTAALATIMDAPALTTARA